MLSKQTANSATLRNNRKAWWAWGLYRNIPVIDAVRGRRQNSRLFFSKSVTKSLKRGVRVSHTRSTRASHGTREPPSLKKNTKQTNKQRKRKKGQSSNNVFITVHTIEWPNINIGMPVLSAVTCSMCLKTFLT